MSVEDIIRARQIREVLHFTTNKGLLGILDGKAIKSRAALRDDQRIEHILKFNTPTVMDPSWIDYVNLSITRINSSLYNISSGRWHTDVWWCVLAFDPIILTHADVRFVTTNNIYPAARRGLGEGGLNALFSEQVLARYSEVMNRTSVMPSSVPTCEQAEVLYPGEISTDFLQRIYVNSNEDQDDVYGQIAGVSHPDVDVVIDPGKFKNEY